MNFPPGNLSRRQVVAGAIAIFLFLLFVPSNTTDTALIELVVGNLPTTALYSLSLLVVTVVGVIYVVTSRTDQTADTQ